MEVGGGMSHARKRREGGEKGVDSTRECPLLVGGFNG